MPLDTIIWNKIREKNKPELKPTADGWLMDTMPFHAVIKTNLQEANPLQYQCEGKYISFKPMAISPSNSMLSEDK